MSEDLEKFKHIANLKCEIIHKVPITNVLSLIC